MGPGPTRLASSQGERFQGACRAQRGGAGRAGWPGQGLGVCKHTSTLAQGAGPVLPAVCPQRAWAPRQLSRERGLRLRLGAWCGELHFKELCSVWFSCFLC